MAELNSSYITENRSDLFFWLKTWGYQPIQEVESATRNLLFCS